MIPSQDAPRKRRKLSEFAGLPVSSEHWEDFKQSVVDFEANHVLGNSKAVFHFVEGPLITALRLGHWYASTQRHMNEPKQILGFYWMKSI